MTHSTLPLIDDAALVRQIAHGDSGEVWEGSVDGQPCAIKLMKLRRRREERSFARGNAIGVEISGEHPNLVTIHRYGRWTDGRACIVMELLVGPNLDQIGAEIRKDYPVIRRIGHDMLQVLMFLKERGVDHLNIRPSNIMLTTQGHVKLGNFRRAARARPGVNLPIDDRYMLGATIYELLSGGPYDGHPTQVESLMRHLK